MRTAIILVSVALAATASAAGPVATVAFTKPLWERPADLEKFAQTWPGAPLFSEFRSEPIAAPELVAPPDAPPEENHLHRGPSSEEWECFVPLQRTQPPAVGKVSPNRCQTPSLEKDKLFHLL
jgi:hypothetical protein